MNDWNLFTGQPIKADWSNLDPPIQLEGDYVSLDLHPSLAMESNPLPTKSPDVITRPAAARDANRTLQMAQNLIK